MGEATLETRVRINESDGVVITGGSRVSTEFNLRKFLRRQFMTKIKYFAAALVFTACAGTLPGTANAANTAEKAILAAPTKDALVTLEKTAYEAWKSKDTNISQ